MATKLGLFNNALLELGHKPLSDTGEAVVAGRTLVDVYDAVVAECLSEGSWNFAMETIKATSDTGVEPGFGYSEVFAKPSDWVRTYAVSGDEYFTYPLTQFYDDSTFWSADYSPIYVRYVSNDTGLGMDLSRWPALFERYVTLELASRVCYKITQSMEIRGAMESMRDIARTKAKNKDSMDESQPKFPPEGSWSRSRSGRSSRGDRGNRGSFTG